MIAGCGRLDQRADFGTACEGDEIDSPVVCQCGAGLLPEARHDVDRTFRKSGFGGELRDPQRHEAGFLSRLHDRGVAHGQRGRDRAPEHLARIVPGDDVASHAQRFVDGGDEVAVEKRDRVAVDLVGGAAVIFEVARHGDGIGARLLHRLAGIASLNLGEFLRVIGDEASQSRQKPAPLGRRQPSPRSVFDSMARGRDREVDVMSVAGGDRGKRHALGRRDDGNGFAGVRRAPRIVDEHALGGCSFHGRVHAHLPDAQTSCRACPIMPV